MRKKLLSAFALLIVLCLTLAFPVTAAAENTPQLGYVTDTAGILTEEQAQSLADLASRIAQQYQCGLYIVTINDYRDYTSEGVEECAEGIYDYYDLGLGEDRNGMLLLLSMNDRDYDLAAYGSDAHYTFTDYGKEVLSREFLDDFRRDDWYGGFEDYLNYSAQMLEVARNGQPVDVPGASENTELHQEMGLGTKAAIALVPSCGIAFGACGVFKSQMKTARKKTTAENYVIPGGVNLMVREDVYLNSTQHVEIIETEHRSSGGGGTSINSAGFSHHSGKF